MTLRDLKEAVVKRGRKIIQPLLGSEDAIVRKGKAKRASKVRRKSRSPKAKSSRKLR